MVRLITNNNERRQLLEQVKTDSISTRDQGFSFTYEDRRKMADTDDVNCLLPILIDVYKMRGTLQSPGQGWTRTVFGLGTRLKYLICQGTP